MSVLIKGMEMPKDIEPGLVIEFADGIDGKRYARLYHYRHGGLTEWLEAVPVPPHGRLIDADELRCLYDPHDYGLDGEQADEYDRYHVSLPVIRQNIDDMPTIIPAEEGET